MTGRKDKGKGRGKNRGLGGNAQNISVRELRGLLEPTWTAIKEDEVQRGASKRVPQAPLTYTREQRERDEKLRSEVEENKLHAKLSDIVDQNAEEEHEVQDWGSDGESREQFMGYERRKLKLKGRSSGDDRDFQHLAPAGNDDEPDDESFYVDSLSLEDRKDFEPKREPSKQKKSKKRKRTPKPKKKKVEQDKSWYNSPDHHGLLNLAYDRSVFEVYEDFQSYIIDDAGQRLEVVGIGIVKLMVANSSKPDEFNHTTLRFGKVLHVPKVPFNFIGEWHGPERLLTIEMQRKPGPPKQDERSGVWRASANRTASRLLKDVVSGERITAYFDEHRGGWRMLHLEDVVPTTQHNGIEPFRSFPAKWPKEEEKRYEDLRIHEQQCEYLRVDAAKHETLREHVGEGEERGAQEEGGEMWGSSD